MPDGTVVAWRHYFSTDHFHSSSGVISLATIVTVGGCSASDALVDQFADDVGMSSVSGQFTDEMREDPTHRDRFVPGVTRAHGVEI
ncbi:unannotated protein [freshwater metagenome]|uniref:Unannotated protein n=1 Tax=freshwater metagenome TaxID=449393 RepID=A0A6J7JL67_9ZZZZ